MNALSLQKVKKSFQDFTLGEISFTLPQGCIMGLIGQNGAGKSTTMRLILHMLRPDSGSIEVLGQHSESEFSHVKSEIGVVLDEMGCPDCLTPMQVGKMLQNIYTNWEEDTYESYLKKLELPRNKAFKEFSRGMKMKLSIACALSHQAKLLILDEPTGGLDPVARDQVVELFSEFTRDETHSILISSHIVSDLEKLCDYVVFFHKGQILLQNEKDRLLEEYGVVSCIQENLQALPSRTIVGEKTTPYGACALVRRDMLPVGWEAGPVSLEELFVWMVREESER